MADDKPKHDHKSPEGLTDQEHEELHRVLERLRVKAFEQAEKDIDLIQSDSIGPKGLRRPRHIYVKDGRPVPSHRMRIAMDIFKLQKEVDQKPMEGNRADSQYFNVIAIAVMIDDYIKQLFDPKPADKLKQ